MPGATTETRTVTIPGKMLRIRESSFEIQDERGTSHCRQVKDTNMNIGPVSKLSRQVADSGDLIGTGVEYRPRQNGLPAFAFIPDRNDRSATLGNEPALLAHLVASHVIVDWV